MIADCLRSALLLPVKSKGVFWIQFTSKQYTGKLLRKAAVLLSKTSLEVCIRCLVMVL